MRGRRAVAATLAAAGCVLALSGPGEAASPQRGLQALVDAAAPGDVVRPPAGTYAGPVVIRTPIVLDGGGDVTIDGGGTGTLIRLETDGAEVRGLRLIGSGDNHDGLDAGVDRKSVV